MKKKIVRLTESDLVHIVKKVINEQSSGARQVAGPYNVEGTQLSYYIFDNNGKFFIYQTNASVKEPTLMKGTVWNNNGPGYDTMAQAQKVITQQLSSNNNKKLKESDLVRIVKKVLKEQRIKGDIPWEFGNVKTTDSEPTSIKTVSIESLPKEIKDFAERYELKLEGDFDKVWGNFFLYKNTHVISVDDIKKYEENKNRVSQCENEIENYKPRRIEELAAEILALRPDIPSNAAFSAANNQADEEFEICDAVVRAKKFIDFFKTKK